MSTSSPLPFRGKLVRLRAREPGDERLLYEWFNDPDVTEHLTVRYPVSHATEKAFLDQHSQPAYNQADFAVVTLKDDTLIGSVGLSVASPEDRCGVLGITIGDKRHWDRGYGTDAMKVICRVGFDTMNLHRIELEVYGRNQRAQTVYTRVGFAQEGRKRQAIYRNGRYDDVIIMGLLRDEFSPE